ncbi:MAG: hypothetical protein GTN76_07100 [Candidatus Aenigmarchaeota archaeon]|nr:hypothetical protein [Candidatus Aenigmarchaeota archaeon]
MSSVLATVGLLLIILGWLVQLYISAARRIFALSLKFVVIYAVGCILLVIGAIQTGNILIWILNLVAAILALTAGYFAKKARP